TLRPYTTLFRSCPIAEKLLSAIIGGFNYCYFLLHKTSVQHDFVIELWIDKLNIHTQWLVSHSDQHIIMGIGEIECDGRRGGKLRLFVSSQQKANFPRGAI